MKRMGYSFAAVAFFGVAFVARAETFDVNAMPEATEFANLVDDEFTIFEAQGDLPEACRQVNPTPDQKTAARKALMAAKRASLVTETELKSLKLDCFDLLANSEATVQASSSLNAKMLQALNKHIGIWLDFKTTLFYDVLKPEQRMPAAACLIQLFKAKMGHAHGV